MSTKKKDKNGRILILDIKVDETNYAQVNIYNPNTKTEQLATPLDLGEMLKTKDLYDKHIVLAGDFISFYFTFQLIPRFIRKQTNSEKENL